MAKKVFTSKFSYGMPTDELRKIMSVAAPVFSAVPGCCWKIWLIDEDRKEAGGLYLFESAAKLEQFLNSDLWASVINNPAFNHFQTNTFGVDEAAGVITSAPIFHTSMQHLNS